MTLDLAPELRARFPGPGTFDQILQLEGPALRELEGRRTLRFEWAGRGYYAKIHHGVGWREIVKCLLAFRLPVLGAEDEVLALERLRQLGVPALRVVGFGSRGVNPARRESFLITEELPDMISLEHLCERWPANPPPLRFKRALIALVAEVARTLHRNGLNHRDFYLCHFLLARESLEPPFRPENLRLHLIDLHRMQQRRSTPRRWVIKDLAGLYFSSLDAGLTRRDMLRFMRGYEARRLRDVFRERRRFWRSVERRATRLYRRIQGRDPVPPGSPCACPG